MKFKDKIVVCEKHIIHETTHEYLEKWLTSLLIRMKVDESKVHRILNDENYSKRAWRTELFYKHGIEIIKYPDKVIVLKHSDRAGDVVLGEWRDPNIVYVKNSKNSKCEIHLNYWQIV